LGIGLLQSNKSNGSFLKGRIISASVENLDINSLVFLGTIRNKIAIISHTHISFQTSLVKLMISAGVSAARDAIGI
jgi:hypothetical protein